MHRKKTQTHRSLIVERDRICGQLVRGEVKAVDDRRDLMIRLKELAAAIRNKQQ